MRLTRKLKANLLRFVLVHFAALKLAANYERNRLVEDPQIKGGFARRALLQYGCQDAKNYAVCLLLAALPLPMLIFRLLLSLHTLILLFPSRCRRRHRRRLGWTLGNIIENFYRKLC